MTRAISKSHIVTLPYDPTWTALEWAKKHCPSYITNDLHSGSESHSLEQIDYYFLSSKDAMWFTLRWL